MEIQDVVHGSFEIPSDIASIVKTAQFQRLKGIRQLGFLYKIEPNANYTRYEHCLGTYFLARKMLNRLDSSRQLSTVYRQAVEIAALLHDIGHGPFSHTWEQIVQNYNHEENALPCVDAIFASLRPDCLQELRENNNYGIELIKGLILGDYNRLTIPLPAHYRFLFEIVHNKQCKLDVDKLDYLKRDGYYLRHMCAVNTDFDDIFLEARIADDGSHIQYRFEDYAKIYALFEARWNFHVNCYRLPSSTKFDELLCRIVKCCENRICGKKVCEIDATNMAAFLQFTDEKVLELGKSDIHYQHLVDPTKIKSIKLAHDEIWAGEENTPFKLLAVENVIVGPGEEMPRDECFHFYGNENEKKNINRNRKPTTVIEYFQLS